MKEEEKLTFGGHLEVLRKMLFRILGLTACVGILIFCFKDWTFQMLLAPSKHDFVLYQWIERLCEMIGWNFVFEEYSVNLIATELSSQFMTHLSTSIYLALLAVSPYIVVELFRFISPALYENERKYSKVVGIAVYGLFVIGVLISYYVIFPISFRFLGTYQVADAVVNNITLKSYISTFTTLTFVMGVVFQLPILAFFMAKLGVIDAEMMSRYRRHAFMLILIVSAIITPPDIFTLILVSIPLYMLYEVSIWVVRKRVMSVFK